MQLKIHECSPSRDGENLYSESEQRWTGQGPAGLAVKPLDLGSIPTGPTHGEGRLQPHPGDVLKSTPNVRKSPRSGLNLEGRLSDPQFLDRSNARTSIGRTDDTRIEKAEGD